MIILCEITVKKVPFYCYSPEVRNLLEVTSYLKIEQSLTVI